MCVRALERSLPTNRSFNRDEGDRRNSTGPEER